MTTETNKDLVRRYVAAMNAHDLDAVVALSAPELKNHAALPEAQGAAGMRRILEKLWKAMPDMTSTCEDLLADGDRVVCRMRVRGTQTGPFEMTSFPLPASGRETSTEQIHIFRVEDGRIVEHWAGRDDIGMLRQLGHLPAKAVAS